MILFKDDDKNREIYILGTIHTYHYTQSNDYSIANIQSVIEIIKPDILPFEVRQETVVKFKALDDPSEMIFAWCYARESGIEVKGIDWWEITEDGETVEAERGGRMFGDVLSEINGEQKSLVLCGASYHKRFVHRLIKMGIMKIN